MEHTSEPIPDGRYDVLLSMVRSIQEGDLQPDRDSHVGRQQNVELVKQVLSELPKRAHEVLIRFYVQEQTPEQICRELGITPNQLRSIKSRARDRFIELSRLRLASATVRSNRTKGGAPGHTDAAVLAHALDTFGSQQKADHWLHRPNHIFQGRTPLEALESDPEAVEIELTRIDHGVYI